MEGKTWTTKCFQRHKQMPLYVPPPLAIENIGGAKFLGGVLSDLRIIYTVNGPGGCVIFRTMR